MSEGAIILVVEDSAIQRVVLSRLLKQAGYEVVAALDGVEGLEQASLITPRLIITDIAMPNLDGYEMCRKIKEIPELEKIPILLLTGLDDPAEVIRGLSAGADNYLTKPYDPQDLLNRVNNLLNQPPEELGPGNQEGMQVTFAGETYMVNASRRRTLNLLLSTYENAVLKNRELIRTQLELKVLNDNLEEKVAQRTHQLERTPMNAIIGMTDIVLKGDLDPEQRSFLEIVRQSSDNLMGLLNNLLDFSRLESGTLKVYKRSFSLRELLQRTVHPFLSRIKEKGLLFECRVAAGFPDIFVGDDNRIQEILKQLLSNGVKYTDSGQVKVDAALENHAANHAITLRLTVTDTGIGVSKALKKDLFESFIQGDGSYTRKQGGTGLGLSLARSLAKLLEGEIGFESEEGKGSVFYLTVPLQLSHEVGDNEIIQKDFLLCGEAGELDRSFLKVESLSRSELVAEIGQQLEKFVQAYQARSMSDADALLTWMKSAAQALGEDDLGVALLRLSLASRKQNEGIFKQHMEQVKGLIGKMA
ncbi:MAG: response regulator [Magnetococcus sp. DMHC-6]